MHTALKRGDFQRRRQPERRSFKHSSTSRNIADKQLTLQELRRSSVVATGLLAKRCFLFPHFRPNDGSSLPGQFEGRDLKAFARRPRPNDASKRGRLAVLATRCLWSCGESANGDN